jgi:hypothetical protein
MKVVYIKKISQTKIDTLTNGKVYEVLETFSFGNRLPEFKVINDKGTLIWVESIYFELLDKKRESTIDSLLN